jgi:hypothetical protein
LHKAQRAPFPLGEAEAVKRRLEKIATGTGEVPPARTKGLLLNKIWSRPAAKAKARLLLSAGLFL